MPLISCMIFSDMAPNLKVPGLAIVIMGVSGSGKSTIAQMLSESLHCSFIEADDFHPQSNKEKMKNGIPLTDEDRIPWLESLRDCIKITINKKETVTLTCSALKKKYREILRSADENYKLGHYGNCKVMFICLNAPREVIEERVRKRSEEGKHFMPPSLLKSQFDLFEIEEEEGVIMVDAAQSVKIIMGKVLALFNVAD